MSDLIDRKNAIDYFVTNIGVVDADGYAVDDYDERVKVWTESFSGIPSAERKRKTFHVIDKTTGKEADPYEIALNEDWAKSLCYCDMVGFAILEDDTLILVDECGRFEFIQENDRFEIVWDEVTDED